MDRSTSEKTIPAVFSYIIGTRQRGKNVTGTKCGEKENKGGREGGKRGTKGC